MKKKILLNILLSLFLYILLSLSSNVYCSSPKNATEFENKTREIMSYMATNNTNYVAFNKFLNSNAWALNKNSIPFSNYDNLILRSWRDTSVNWYIDLIFYNGDKNLYVNGEFVNANPSFSTTRYRFDNKNNNNTYATQYIGEGEITIYDNDSLKIDVNNNFRFCVFFIENDIINLNNATLWGYNYPVLDYFSYNYISTLNDIVVDNDFSTMKQISNRDISSYVAEFGLYNNLDLSTYKPRYTIYKYMKPQNYFEPIVSYDYVSYQKVNDSLGRIYLTDEMLIPNTVLEINLFPTSLDDFSPLSILFYITDSNTIITTDSTTGKPKVDEDNTFNDDYYTRYTNIINNILNENKGNITSPSGDITGSIDFSPLVEQQEEQFDFWKNAYNNLFTISSGDMENIINNYIDETNLSGFNNASGEKMILGILDDEPGDFVIEWNQINLPNLGYNESQKIIGSGKINFSQFQITYDGITYQPQNTEAIQNASNVARTIMGYTVVVLMLANIWETLMRVLGVGVDMYEANEEEKERMGIQVSTHETWNYDTGMATISTTRRQGNNSVTVTGKQKIRKRIE